MADPNLTRSAIDLKSLELNMEDVQFLTGSLPEFLYTKENQNLDAVYAVLSEVVKKFNLVLDKELKDTEEFINSRSPEYFTEVQDKLNYFMKEFSSFSKTLSFQNNFDGYIANVTFPASGTVRIEHFLGVTPKWRVVLRQEGNGVLSDISSGWTNEYITMKNNGIEVVTASILIARE
jgi:hypothetical protein